MRHRNREQIEALYLAELPGELPPTKGTVKERTVYSLAGQVPKRLDGARARESLLELMGQSNVVREIEREVEQVARSKLSVVITGETGVGKELVARAIHDASPRATHPCVDLDCGAFPEHMVARSPFGDVRLRQTALPGPRARTRIVPISSGT
jgi:DNA-binding NtrC family response regulator